MDLSGLKWDAAGLLTVVVQEGASGEVRMVAHANREALERTVSEGAAWFFSRSRNALWKKGETSGNGIAVSEVWVDCDGDAVIYVSEAHGPSCHTGRRTCFFRRIEDLAERSEHASPVLVRLWDVLLERRAASGEKSYTRSLLEKGPAKIAEKVREEGDELARAIESESEERVVSEAADVLYHAMVGLLARGVTLADVERELVRRFGVSGHEEKARR